MNAQHTPDYNLPWELDDRSDPNGSPFVEIAVVDKSGEFVAELRHDDEAYITEALGEQKRNECYERAEFIVRACNSHEELVKAVEYLRAAYFGDKLAGQPDDVIGFATAAIQKARGEAWHSNSSLKALSTGGKCASPTQTSTEQKHLPKRNLMEGESPES